MAHHPNGSAGHLGDAEQPHPVAAYGIIVEVTRYSDGKALAEVGPVYGPLIPYDVANLLRVAADRLEREQQETPRPAQLWIP